jgi:2-oxoglutarate dehydrogenase E1 component
MSCFARFGLEGCEVLLPGLLTLVDRCSQHGVMRIEMGMAHRGRLNLLVNLLNKPLGALCTEMEGRQSDWHVGKSDWHAGKSDWHVGKSDWHAGKSDWHVGESGWHVGRE